jgi:hypothetical protein
MSVAPGSPLRENMTLSKNEFMVSLSEGRFAMLIQNVLVRGTVSGSSRGETQGQIDDGASN